MKNLDHIIFQQEKSKNYLCFLEENEMNLKYFDYLDLSKFKKYWNNILFLLAKRFLDIIKSCSTNDIRWWTRCIFWFFWNWFCTNPKILFSLLIFDHLFIFIYFEIKNDFLFFFLKKGNNAPKYALAIYSRIFNFNMG